MPKIITSTGVVKYKTVPIYLGIKQIDKIKSEKNLALLKKVLDKHNVSFLLFYGTLLGAVREKDFITHDEDIDLAILDEERLKFIDSIPDLMSVGFKVARYDRRGLLSIIKDGEYIDFYFFSKYNDNLRCCSGILCPDEFLENVAEYEFKGNIYLVPRNFKEYLIFEYGNNWMTPIQWNNFSMPRWKISLLKIKEVIKTLLPDSIYFILAKHAEKKMEQKYKQKIDKYYKEKQV